MADLPHKETWRDVLQTKNKANVVALVLAAVILVLGYGFIGWRIIVEMTSQTAVTSKSAAPWSQQLALAQQAADKIEPGSVLTSTEAQPADDSKLRYTSTDTLALYFVFLAPSGRMTGVKVEDSTPPTIKYTADAGTAKSKPDAAQLSKLTTAVAEIKVSPRDVLAIVAADLRTKGKSTDTPLPEMQLFFKQNAAPDIQSRYSTDAEYSGTYGDFAFVVDATNGNILRESDISAEPSPTASP